MMFKKKSKVNKIVSILLAIFILFTAMVIDLPDNSSEVEAAARIPKIMLKGHVQDIGWMSGTDNGKVVSVGTEGRSLRLEAVQMYIDASYSGSFFIQVGDNYYSTTSCGRWSSVVGTTGLSQPLHYVAIQLQGPIKYKFDVVYRVHVQDIGWMDWVKNGQIAGKPNSDKRVEKLEVKLVRK